MTGTRPAPDPPHASNVCARARSASSRFDLGRTCRTHTASPAVEAAARPVRRVRRSSYDTGHVPRADPLGEHTHVLGGRVVPRKGVNLMPFMPHPHAPAHSQVRGEKEKRVVRAPGCTPQSH